ncbi:hypothetical protein [Halothiobacillus sp.]|uniref:hypothetical protein n=1 Tax=Halothiobacillus sp. TaxID=1891311 RepID=UPI002AD3C341|nr:hypothetical protein [Halothiobacillus sp.]
MPDFFATGRGWPIYHLSGGYLQLGEAEIYDGMLFRHHQTPHGHTVDIVYGLGMGTVIEVRLPIRQFSSFFAFFF